jgi:hypothetical protein
VPSTPDDDIPPGLHFGEQAEELVWWVREVGIGERDRAPMGRQHPRAHRGAFASVLRLHEHLVGTGGSSVIGGVVI